MDKNTTPKSGLGLVWLAIGTAIGFGAAKIISKQKPLDKSIFDLDSVIESCERAAAKLDDRMRGESAAPAKHAP